ncbi:MAG: EAL domain-containing protein [Burkholderiales bacterium]|nr:EAL domain-containing protein [Burkholderiales bacterium]
MSLPEIAPTVRLALEKKRVIASPILFDAQSKKKYIELVVVTHPNLSQIKERTKLLPLGALRMRIELETFFRNTLKDHRFDDFLLKVEDISDVPTTIFNMFQVGERHEFQHRWQLGQRSYQFSFSPSKSYLDNHLGWESWIVLTFCLFITSVLGCMLLVVSGDKARIFALVRESTSHLHERETRLQAILDHATDAILTVNHHGQLVSANNAACTQFGFTADQVPMKNLTELLQLELPLDMRQLLHRYDTRDGEEVVLNGIGASGHFFPAGFAISEVTLKGESFFVCILRDLTEQRRSQEKIHHLAHHDPLTGLANRIMLNLRLDQLLAISRRNKAAVAVMFVDIDHFKKINDTHGHQIGDMFLREFARRLQELVRDADTIARFGGDEFIVVLAEQDSADHVTMVANRIVNALAAPYVLADLVLHSGASIGIAMFPADGDDSKLLLRNADIAMYAAKNLGRGNFQFFSNEMNQATHERLMLENRLWKALEEDEFTLYLQPQISLKTGELIGAEALIRWISPELGLVPPDRFIPVAEDTSLMLPLGEWVLQRAVKILRDWKGTSLQHLRLAVNLSARQCQINTLLPLVDKLLQESGVEASKLEMEITETAAMNDPEQTRELLRGLRQRGIQVAIDDFGTGYSSLSYLKLFAIDRIKIDRSFVKDIESDPNDAVIVGATIALAHSLGLEVIAEGVETEAQCRYLRERDCDQVQGYYFSRPLALSDFVAFCDAQHSI